MRGGNSGTLQLRLPRPVREPTDLDLEVSPAGGPKLTEVYYAAWLRGARRLPPEGFYTPGLTGEMIAQGYTHGCEDEERARSRAKQLGGLLLGQAQERRKLRAEVQEAISILQEALGSVSPDSSWKPLIALALEARDKLVGA